MMGNFFKKRTHSSRPPLLLPAGWPKHEVEHLLSRKKACQELVEMDDERKVRIVYQKRMGQEVEVKLSQKLLDYYLHLTQCMLPQNILNGYCLKCCGPPSYNPCNSCRNNHYIIMCLSVVCPSHI